MSWQTDDIVEVQHEREMFFNFWCLHGEAIWNLHKEVEANGIPQSSSETCPRCVLRDRITPFLNENRTESSRKL